MAKIKLYHGTSQESYNSILEHGFDSGRFNDMVWNCSDDDYTYFYNPLNFIESGECDDMESAQNMCIERAFENARIGASVQKSKAESMFVVCVEVELSDVESDDSCDNMELSCKVESSKISAESIIEVYESDFIYTASLLYIAGLMNNDWIILDNFSQAELNLMRTLAKDDYYDDDLYYIEYEQVK